MCQYFDIRFLMSFFFSFSLIYFEFLIPFSFVQTYFLNTSNYSCFLFLTPAFLLLFPSRYHFLWPRSFPPKSTNLPASATRVACTVKTFPLRSNLFLRLNTPFPELNLSVATITETTLAASLAAEGPEGRLAVRVSQRPRSSPRSQEFVRLRRDLLNAKWAVKGVRSFVLSDGYASPVCQGEVNLLVSPF